MRSTLNDRKRALKRLARTVHPTGNDASGAPSGEMIYQALLLSAIGTDQDHFPVLLVAADSTLEGMLSINVNVVEEGADASSSHSIARW